MWQRWQQKARELRQHLGRRGMLVLTVAVVLFSGTLAFVPLTAHAT